MPKKTFENLPDEKRGRILAAAIEEFASHEFAAAKLDRIAAAAGVPKGSLYQYFETKDEFYVHTVRHALDEAWRFFLDDFERLESPDCFAMIAESLRHIVELKERMPHHAALYARVVFSSDAHAKKRLFPKYLDYSDQFYDRLISIGVADKMIDATRSYDEVRFQINALCSQYQFFVLYDAFPRWIPEEERSLAAFTERIIDSLRAGLAPKGVSS